jgi:Hypothetical protein (DUF2513)
MQRDMDTVRRILIAVADATGPVESVPDCDDSVFSYHVALLIEGGLVRGDVSDGPNLQPIAGSIFRLTWAGHEFLDIARNDTAWNTVREKILRPGVSWSFSILGEVLKAFAKQQLAHAGLPMFATPEA